MSNELASTPVADATIPDPLDDVSAGKMPAVSLPPIVGRNTTPQAEFIVTNFHDLGKFNLDYHEFPNGVSVIYNPQLTSAKHLEEAHAKGDLFSVAPLVGAPDPRQGGTDAPNVADPGAAPAAAPAAPAAPADDGSLAGATAPAAASAPLAGAKVPLNRRVQSVRLQNSKVPGPNQPNPVTDQLAKRPV